MRWAADGTLVQPLALRMITREGLAPVFVPRFLDRHGDASVLPSSARVLAAVALVDEDWRRTGLQTLRCSTVSLVPGIAVRAVPVVAKRWR